MEAVVLVVTIRGKTSRFELTSGSSMVLGRAESCDVIVDDRLASRRHLTITLTAGRVLLEDLGSNNGTTVLSAEADANGESLTVQPSGAKLEAHQAVPVGLGDVVQIGAALITFEVKGRRRATTQHDPDELVVDPSMVRLYELAQRVAGSDLSVLVLGESGVGKDVLARFIHRRSERSGAELVSINCGAMSETLLESELFGYEKGAFTGANKSTDGLLEAADGGTLFLDEAGELPAAFQVKLLRVLEAQTFMRVGGREPISVNVRFIAATNRDLGSQITEGKFREDLYYRLNGISLTIPALRERPAEILPLALRFLDLAGEERKLEYRLTQAASDKLRSYSWPGNVRQLKNVIRRAAVLCIGNTVDADLIQLPAVEGTPSLLARGHRATPTETYSSSAGSSVANTPEELRAQAEAMERQQIVDALESCAGNQTRAAQMLGLTRRAFGLRLSKYNIPRPRKGRE